MVKDQLKFVGRLEWIMINDVKVIILAETTKGPEERYRFIE